MDVFKLLFQEIPEASEKKINRILMLCEDSLYVNANIDIFYIAMTHFFILCFKDET